MAKNGACYKMGSIAPRLSPVKLEENNVSFFKLKTKIKLKKKTKDFFFLNKQKALN